MSYITPLLWSAGFFTTIAVVDADKKGLTNGPELVRILQDQYGVECYLNREGKVFMADVSGLEDAHKAIGRLSQVESLQVVQLGGAVDAELLGTLSKARNLTVLRLDGCKLKDADLEALKTFHKLYELNLDNTPITDAGLLFLKSLKKLEILRLSGTKVSGKGFEHLQSLPRLRYVTLEMTPISDSGLSEIAKVHSIQHLTLSNTQLTDTGLNRLARLYLLTSLAISNTRVTDVGKAAFLQSHVASRATAEEKGVVPKGHPKLTLIADEPKPQNVRPLKAS